MSLLDAPRPGTAPHVMEDGAHSKMLLLRGAYMMCARLLTSPRFNRPQREVIEEQAYAAKDELEALGVTFESETKVAV